MKVFQGETRIVIITILWVSAHLEHYKNAISLYNKDPLLTVQMGRSMRKSNPNNKSFSLKKIRLFGFYV
jgi:hypothetical protein